MYATRTVIKFTTRKGVIDLLSPLHHLMWKADLMVVSML